VNLSVLERLVLLNVLPREGTVTTVKIVRELRETLSFSEEEHAALKFERTESGGTEWDTGGEKDKEIDFAPRALALVVETLERMDKEQKVTEDYLSIFEKFVS